MVTTTLTVSPGRRVCFGLATRALTRKVEVLGLTVSSMKNVMPVLGHSCSPSIPGRTTFTANPF